MNRTQLAKMADTMIELAKEIKLALKEDKQLFAMPRKETVVASGEGNVRRAIEAQEVIKKWRYNWAKIYRNDPLIEKKWVYMTTSVLRRIPVTTVYEALNNFFDSQEPFLERQRYPYPLFITHINKYLPEGRIGHEDIRQMGPTAERDWGRLPDPNRDANRQRELLAQQRDDSNDEEPSQEQFNNE